MSYTRDPTEQGRYVENTIVTVSCDEGYRGGGDITCQHDETWSSAGVPNCTSEGVIIANAWCSLGSRPPLLARMHEYLKTPLINCKYAICAWTRTCVVASSPACVQLLRVAIFEPPKNELKHHA